MGIGEQVADGKGVLHRAGDIAEQAHLLLRQDAYGVQDEMAVAVVGAVKRHVWFIVAIAAEGVAYRLPVVAGKVDGGVLAGSRNSLAIVHLLGEIGKARIGAYRIVVEAVSIGIAAPCLNEVVILVAVFCCLYLFLCGSLLRIAIVETPNTIIPLVVEEDALVESVFCPSLRRAGGANLSNGCAHLLEVVIEVENMLTLSAVFRYCIYYAGINLTCLFFPPFRFGDTH